MEQHSVARLIGSPPGYIGHEEGGQLTEQIRRKPYTVLLFDEVEKAHPQVFNVLLQVLDDGRLTDGQGRTVDFSNTVIILTSNLGAEYLLAALAKADTRSKASIHLDDSTRQQVLSVVKKHFRPEFLNRLDDIVVFSPLSHANLSHIVHLQLANVSKRLAERNITLSLSPAAIEHILTVAYDPIYGARPLRRYLEKQIGTQLSRMLISRELLDASTVKIDAVDDKLTYKVTQQAAAAAAGATSTDGRAAKKARVSALLSCVSSRCACVTNTFLHRRRKVDSALEDVELSATNRFRSPRAPTLTYWPPEE